MSSEFEGDVFGVKGKYKSIADVPYVFASCQHVLVNKGNLLRKKFVVIHGMSDGNTTANEV